MTPLKPIFPTSIHQNAAQTVQDHFSAIPYVDSNLVVNSCARGTAVPESDLDFAILVNPDTTATQINNLETDWKRYSETQPTLLQYKRSSQFAHLHLDIITGKYTPAPIEIGEPMDYLELEIGNQVRYSAPMDKAGPYFQELQKQWMPYYDETLRSQRLTMIQNACVYDLDRIRIFMDRGLPFHAFDILYKAFQEYLQTLFIANRTYPLAYNKCIREQVVQWLKKPELYPRLSPILSVSNIESHEINDKANLLRDLLEELPKE